MIENTNSIIGPSDYIQLYAATNYRVTGKSISKVNRNCYSVHWHSCAEVISVFDSDIILSLNFRHVPVRAGSTVLIPPGVIHDSYCTSGEPRIIVLQFIMPELAGYTESLRSLIESKRIQADADLYMVSPDDEYSREIAELCCIILREVKQSLTGSESLVTGGVMQLRGYFERAFRLQLVPLDPLADMNFDLLSICDFIGKNITNGLTLAKAAEFTGYSPTYFSTKFHIASGTNFREYVDFVKMRKALRILLSGNVKVSEAAELFGYDNIQNFSRAFRRVNKVLPSQVKQYTQGTSTNLI